MRAGNWAHWSATMAGSTAMVEPSGQVSAYLSNLADNCPPSKVDLAVIPEG